MGEKITTSLLLPQELSGYLVNCPSACESTGCTQVSVNTMPRMKDVSNKLGVATVAAHQYGKGYKVRNTIRKWETFKTAASVPRRGRPTKFVPRSDREMFRETEKTKATSHSVQLSVSMLTFVTTQLEKD